jgi:hypothetical protein
MMEGPLSPIFSLVMKGSSPNSLQDLDITIALIIYTQKLE